MTTATEALEAAVSRLDESLLRDMIVRTVCDKVGDALQAGRTPEQAGREAYEALRGRGWLPAWMRLFGPQFLVGQWRSLRASPALERFMDAVEEIPMLSPPLASHVTEVDVQPGAELSCEIDRIADAVTEPPTDRELSVDRLSPHQSVAGSRSVGKTPSVMILSKEIDRLLKAPVRVAGIWITAGELRANDLRTKWEENRERTKSIVRNARRRRDAYLKLASYFHDDITCVRDLAVKGVISQDDLRAAFEEDER